MGREVRMVPPDWEHPRDVDGRLVPLYSGYIEHLHGRAQWARGLVTDYNGGWKPKDSFDTTEALSWEEYAGDRKPETYMPCWPESACTHFQMYETCSEGTPISPPMPTPESLARWLADNDASAFGDETASYEAWLRTIAKGFALSAMVVDGVLMSGVEACK